MSPGPPLPPVLAASGNNVLECRGMLHSDLDAADLDEAASTCLPPRLLQALQLCLSPPSRHTHTQSTGHPATFTILLTLNHLAADPFTPPLHPSPPPEPTAAVPGGSERTSPSEAALLAALQELPDAHVVMEAVPRGDAVSLARALSQKHSSKGWIRPMAPPAAAADSLEVDVGGGEAPGATAAVTSSA